MSEVRGVRKECSDVSDRNEICKVIEFDEQLYYEGLGLTPTKTSPEISFHEGWIVVLRLMGVSKTTNLVSLIGTRPLAKGGRVVLLVEVLSKLSFRDIDDNADRYYSLTG